MKISRIVALILALCTVLTFAVGCGTSTDAFITFRDTVVDQNKYIYMMSHFKALYLASYFGFGVDNPSIWEQEMGNGVTVGDYLGAMALSNVMSIAMYTQLFDEYGLTVSAEETASIEEQINKLAATAGSEAQLEKELSKYGSDIATVRSVLTDSVKVSKLQNYLFGENGTTPVTDEDIEEYYKENYQRCKFIFIHKTQDYVYDANSEPVFDEDTQKFVTRDMTEEQCAEKKELFEDVKDRIINGDEDFEALLDEYTMESGMRKFTDGYYITSTTTFVPTEVRVLLSTLDVDQIKSVETDNGWYLVKRYELIDGAWKDEAYAAAMFDSLKTTVVNLAMSELITPFADEVVVNTEAVEQYPMSKLTPNFEY